MAIEEMTNLAVVLGTSSECQRSHVGAVLVNSQGDILGIGWNTGTNCESFCPRGQHLFDTVPSSERFDVSHCITQHAEMRCLQSVKQSDAVWHMTSPASRHLSLIMYVAVRPDKSRGTCEQCMPVLSSLGIAVVHV